MHDLPAIAVFCASNPGNQPAFAHAARSVGRAIGKSGLKLVYGGGTEGLMGMVSEATLEAGGMVTGVVPFAMVGPRLGPVSENGRASNADKNGPASWVVMENRRDCVMETVVVNTMHERKVEMAKRVRGFFGLPGGFGTFEEILEMTTWTQLRIHNKPVVLLNVLGYYSPLRDLIQSGIRCGFIHPDNEKLVHFIDGPPDMSTHDTYDWGQDALEALNHWRLPESSWYNYDWTKTLEGDVESPMQVS